MGSRTGHGAVPTESRANVSPHGFWNRRTTTIFDIRIFYTNVVSYQRMTPEKALTKEVKYNKDIYLQA